MAAPDDDDDNVDDAVDDVDDDVDDNFNMTALQRIKLRTANMILWALSDITEQAVSIETPMKING